MDPIAISYEQASILTGYAINTLKAAVKSGDLKPTTPKIDGKGIQKITFFPEELRRWLADETPTE